MLNSLIDHRYRGSDALIQMNVVIIFNILARMQVLQVFNN